MRNSGSSFGMVMLVVVMAVVLLLVARSWSEVAEPALTLDASGTALSTTPAGDDRPSDLQRTRAETDRHTAAVDEALQSID